MTFPPIFNLSNELLLEIISNLCAEDISTCRRTCRKLNALIVDSQFIQYILRTAQSGVSDPLEPGLSLPERLDALQRWETAWAEMDLREPTTRIDAPITSPNGRPVEFSFGRYFVIIREGYGWPAGYSFLDMRAGSCLHAEAARWTTIDIDTPNVLVFAFASELDLVVAISCVNRLRFSSLSLSLLPSSSFLPPPSFLLPPSSFLPLPSHPSSAYSVQDSLNSFFRSCRLGHPQPSIVNGRL
ncbi:hypothetical protein B0F90DRAFT_673125 [Multifurca ochricompacta]|uniref:F-box domain-containing protein n=1 Tax=Multifurca ochricompacta TaxID=376703 RepID=A0AAD4M1W4_9AGAM|nr:hypothetical protein B0F90DRAFT_673125 [Multifurca ochricompacta]